MKKLIFLAILLALFAFAGLTSSLSASPQDFKGVLTPENPQESMDADAIKEGRVYFLVKQNPTHLNANDVVFQATNSTFYINASLEDLGKPNAKQHLLIAKVTKKGPIKVVTLANVGYVAIREMQNSNGATEFYLLTQKGKLVKIVKIAFTPSLPRYKEDMTKKKKPAVVSSQEEEDDG